ncbi:conserved hypothetical protein, partial [Ricinus communis]
TWRRIRTASPANTSSRCSRRNDGRRCDGSVADPRAGARACRRRPGIHLGRPGGRRPWRRGCHRARAHARLRAHARGEGTVARVLVRTRDGTAVGPARADRRAQGRLLSHTALSFHPAGSLARAGPLARVTDGPGRPADRAGDQAVPRGLPEPHPRRDRALPLRPRRRRRREPRQVWPVESLDRDPHAAPASFARPGQGRIARALFHQRPRPRVPLVVAAFPDISRILPRGRYGGLCGAVHLPQGGCGTAVLIHRVERLADPHRPHVHPDAVDRIRILAVRHEFRRVGHARERELESAFRKLAVRPFERHADGLLQIAVDQLLEQVRDRRVAEDVRIKNRRAMLDVLPVNGLLARTRRVRARGQVEAVAAVQVADARIGEVEPRPGLVDARALQVEHERTPVADHRHVARRAHDRRRVLVDAQSQRIALGHHRGQHAAEAPAREKVLVDEDVVADEAEARRDVLAIDDAVLQHRHHLQRRVGEHGAAHDGGAGTRARDDAAAPVQRPQRVQHGRVAAVRAPQRTRDAGLVAAREERAAGLADRIGQRRVVRSLAHVRPGQHGRDGDDECARAVAVQRVHRQLRFLRGRLGGRRQHGDARALAARQRDDLFPHLGVVDAQATADDDQRSLGVGWRGGGPCADADERQRDTHSLQHVSGTSSSRSRTRCGHAGPCSSGRIRPGRTRPGSKTADPH